VVFGDERKGSVRVKVTMITIAGGEKGLSTHKRREDCPGSRRCGTTLSREVVKLACCIMPVESVIYGKDDLDSTQPIHPADDRMAPAANSFSHGRCHLPPRHFKGAHVHFRRFAPHHLAAPLVDVNAHGVPARTIAQQPTHFASNRNRVRECHEYATLVVQ